MTTAKQVYFALTVIITTGHLFLKINLLMGLFLLDAFLNKNKMKGYTVETIYSISYCVKKCKLTS